MAQSADMDPEWARSAATFSCGGNFARFEAVLPAWVSVEWNLATFP
jgi:hypothetical protein